MDNEAKAKEIVLKNLRDADSNQTVNVEGYGKILAGRLLKEVNEDTAMGKAFVNQVNRKALEHINSSSLF